jgi:hypothetical protein
MKLDFCAVCGATEDLHQHHLIPVIKTGVKRHKKRYNGNIQLKDAKWEDCFLRLFDLGVITDDGELTLCSYHHNVMHGIVKFHAVEQGKLIKAGMAKAIANGGAGPGRKPVIDEAEGKLIIEERNKGYSIRRLVDKFGHSTGSIQNYLKTMKVSVPEVMLPTIPKPRKKPKPRTIPIELIESVADFHDTGLTVSYISKELGITAAKVNKVMSNPLYSVLCAKKEIQRVSK